VAELTVIRWCDIPMQVLVRGSGGATARAMLPDRFQEAVDAAAMVAGLIGSDDYTEQMRMDSRECGDDLQHEVDTETVSILSEWDEQVLRETIRSGGVRGGEPIAGGGGR
jgi:Virulence factor